MPKLDRPLILGSTSLGTYRDCHEKYRLHYEEMLVPKELEPKKTFGSAFHAAADVYYQTGDVEKAELAFIKVAKKADLPLTIDSKEPRSIERGLTLLHAWIFKWKDEPFRIMRRPDGSPLTEIRFTIPLFEHNGYPVVYSGMIDKIVEARDRVYVLDIKTTTRSLSQFQNSMKPNHQLTGYFVGAQDVLPEGKVFSVGYDAVFISKRQPNPRGDVWLKQGVDIKDDFMRTFTTRSDNDVRLWRKQVVDDAWDVIHDIENTKVPWSMNAPTACWRWGRCEYMDSCLHNQDPIVIASKYQKQDWKPYADSRGDWIGVEGLEYETNGNGE